MRIIAPLYKAVCRKGNRRSGAAGCVNGKGDNDGKDTGENPVADQRSDL